MTVSSHEKRTDIDRVIFWAIAAMAVRSAARAAELLGHAVLADRIGHALSHGRRTKDLSCLEAVIEELRAIERTAAKPGCVGQAAQHTLAYAMWPDHGPFRTDDKLRLARRWLDRASDCLRNYELADARAHLSVLVFLEAS